MRLPPELKAALKEIAAEGGFTLNHVCVSFLRWALEEHRRKYPKK